MDNQVTPTVEKTPEEIEQEMLHTRESLTEKVAALENQVVGTVQTAADTITGTVEAVKSLVTQAPEAVSETVKQAAEVVGEKMKQTFDITGHVRRHPWPAMGVSAGLGFLTALLVFRSRDTSAPAPVAASTPPARTPEVAPSTPGVFDELIGMIGKKVKDLAETAIDTTAAAVKANIQEAVPNLVSEATARLTETNASGDDSPDIAGRFGRRLPA
ncbi:MAG: hypothetical protein L0241_23790 [Planctomycetia bacterium]|nr:hypothetical protein [Planctomycetia bacterium]